MYKTLPKISIITTVFKTEEYLPKCIESILSQTYKNIQLVVVNDCSPGNVVDIVKEYEVLDDRIELVSCEKNIGLFHARLTGADMATGEYIMFIDSDDCIGVDYVRLLVYAAMENNADIVKAQIVNAYDSGEKSVFNYIINGPKLDLKHGCILDEYFEQEGRDFSFHTIWNKLYSKNLWDKCRPYYEHIKTHLIMAEDFAFSTPLMTFAEHLVEIDNETYFYLKRSDSSTGISKDINKFEKNIGDLKTAFDFVEWFLNERGIFDKYSIKFSNWKRLYSRFWRANIDYAGFTSFKKNHLYKHLQHCLEVDVLENSVPIDNYFYSLSTPWNKTLEEYKITIANEDVKVVSFDLFDTLVFRPFMEPTDLFYFLDQKFKTQFPHIEIPFHSLRVDAEAALRKETQSCSEDITLLEIYKYFANMISCNIADLYSFAEEEIKLEIQHCYIRKTGKELFDLAKATNKVICISTDMYLPMDAICKILEKNGYKQIDRIFLSCEINASKRTGKMFQKIVNTYELKNAGQLIHVGDTWSSDVEKAQLIGARALFLPKAIEIYKSENKNKEMYGGRLFKEIKSSKGYANNNSISLKFFAIRCMLALSANHYFDNPFRPYHPESDFNSDLYFMGYGALSLHLIGISLDLAKKSLGKQTIHFVSRDGFLCKKVYEKISKYFEFLPSSNYLHLSRKSMLPAFFIDRRNYSCVKSFLDMNAVGTQSPATILQFFFHVSLDENIEQEFKKNGIELHENFSDEDGLNRFLDICENVSAIQDATQKYVDLVRKYFSAIVKKEDIIFDLGYGGTAQKLLSKVLNFPVDGYYVYTEKETPYFFADYYGYFVKTFYSHTPAISGPVREFFFSESGPSCIGYSEKEEKREQVFEDKKLSYIEKRAKYNIEKGVVDLQINFCFILVTI